MSTTNLILIIVLVSGFIAAVWAYYHSKPQQNKQQINFADPARCMEILACKQLEGRRNLITRLASRAIPNQRLVRAFGIDNAFTTEDEKHANSFKKMAIEKIELSPSDWQRVANLALELVQNYLKKKPGRFASFELERLVQSVSLKIALHILHSLNPLDLHDTAINMMAFSINELWHLSKNQASINDAPQAVELKSELQKALATLSPSFPPESDPKANPLNYILPAYETLWRVIFFCFIEVNFRQSEFTTNAVGWRDKLKESITEKEPESFDGDVAPDSEQQVTVENIVDEALRLYTPTRRIHREYRFQPGSKSERVAADIERMHRNPDIFGMEPLQFNPSRWQSLGSEAREAFMPFGNKPFLCPAKKEFGPKIIGILVAALVTHISPDEWDLRWFWNERDLHLLGDEVLVTDSKASEDKWWEIQRRV